jgi:cell division protein FtsW
MSKSLPKKHVDYWLLAIVSILLVWGLFTVSATSFPLSLQNFDHPWHYVWRQLVMVGGGLLLGLLFFKLKPEWLKKYGPYLFFANIVSLLLVFMPKIGLELQGSHRWLNLWFFLLQPSEFLKIFFAIYLAAWLVPRVEAKKQKRKEVLESWQTLTPFLLVIGALFVILIIQPDLSTLIIIAVMGVAMYFLAGTPVKHFLLLLGAGTAILLAAIKLAPYRLARLTAFLNPEANPLGTGFQLKQALIGLGSGGIAGIGGGLAFGLSKQKFGFLPHPTSDSIFAIVGEELGFLGAVLLVILFVILIWRGFKIANSLEDNFQRILASGIVFWIGFQAFFNIGGIIGILPLGGVPLPFFSQGGSHIITELAAMGILLNFSQTKN